METRAPSTPVEADPPVDLLDDDFPIRLTTGRRLESFNTGVQSGNFSSPLHRNGSALRLAPEDGARYGVADGGRARVVSRRGRVEAETTEVRLGELANLLAREVAYREQELRHFALDPRLPAARRN